MIQFDLTSIIVVVVGIAACSCLIIANIKCKRPSRSDSGVTNASNAFKGACQSEPVSYPNLFEWNMDTHGVPFRLPSDRIQDILFADGFRLTASQIYGRGLLPVVDSDGRIILVVDGFRRTQRTVEDWCGIDHGARLS